MKDLLFTRFRQAINDRRAIKHFQPDFKIDSQLLSEVLTLGFRVPTPGGCNPFRILKIEDNTELRTQLREIGFDQPQFTNASTLLFVSIDINVLASAYSDQDVTDEILRNNAMILGGVFSQAVMLAAAARGLDSCPLIGFKFQPAGELLNKPDHQIITNLVTLGKRAKRPLARGSKIPLGELTVYL